MERLRALGRGTQIMFIASVLLLIISFFNWQEVDFDLGPLGEGSAGVSAWDNFLGILMGILTIVLVARIIARMAAVDVPIPVSFAMTSVVLGVIIAICAILKNLTDDYSTFWSYIGVGLAILVAVGAWLEVQDAGGMDSLKSEASSLSSSVGAGSAPAAATRRRERSRGHGLRHGFGSRRESVRRGLRGLSHNGRGCLGCSRHGVGHGIGRDRHGVGRGRRGHGRGGRRAVDRAVGVTAHTATPRRTCAAASACSKNRCSFTHSGAT